MSIDPVSLAITAALTAANMALTASQKIEGPRLDSTKFTGGDYGAQLPLVWGTRRLELPIFWAEDLKEVKRQRKTKGGKYNEYTYYGTWAVALAGHEIAGIKRIWFDTHLVLDLTGPGPVTPFDFGTGDRTEKQGGSAGVGGTSFNSHMAFYPGSETQEPDPRIMATVEAEFGEGSCPAYRGTAYLVFKDLPLEKLGNRIPQVSVEMVSIVDPVSVHEEFAVAVDPTGLGQWMQFSPDFSRLAWMKDGDFELWDVAARKRMVVSTLPLEFRSFTRFGVKNDGTILACSGLSGESLISIGPEGGTAEEIATFSAPQQGVYVLMDADGNEHWGTTVEAFYGTWYFDGVEYYDAAWRPNHFFADGFGDIWAVGTNSFAGSSTAYFKRMVWVSGNELWPSEFSVSGLGTGTASFGAHIASTDTFALYHDGVLYNVDPADGSVVASGSASFGANIETEWSNLPPGAATIWGADQEYDLATGDLVRDAGVFPPYPYANTNSIYDPVNHALITADATHIRWDYLDRIDGEGVALSQIAGDVADLVGVTDYDFSALDHIVKGWSATQGQASNMLEPLLDAYDSDIRPHDFEIQGVKRSGTSGGTILTERFVKNDPRYTVKIRQAAELPKALIYNFADMDADQQPNNVRSDRPLDATGARGEQTIDLTTFASDADTMRGLSDRHFRRLWNERKEVSLSLTAQQLALEPGDVRTLELDDESMTARLVRLTIGANGVLGTEWKYDHASLALTDGASGAAFDGRNPSEIIIGGLSKGFVLDVPLIRDADSETNPLVYVLAGPYHDGSWPGASALQRVDGEYTDEIAAVPSTNGATWGFVTEAMPYANPNVWDRGTEITVTLNNGELTGTTEAAIDANPRKNLAAIGINGRWEFVNFTTAELTGTDTYLVSGFKRGRRGTEWAAELHEGFDQFVLLDTAQDVEMGLSEVSTAVSFNVITQGRTSGTPFGYTYTGATLKPYAPCHLEGELVSGDWDLSWVRRTRVGGAWTGGSSIPLSEASEQYSVEILYGGEVARTETVTSPAFVWTAAMQTTDTGGAQDYVRFRVYQISDAVGRGYVAEYRPTSTRWRLLFPDGAVGGSSNIQLIEVEMREDGGGSDLCTGGTASASSEYDASHLASAAFDNNSGTDWSTLDPASSINAWLEYTFASPVSVGQLGINPGGGSLAPESFILQLHDEAGWVDIYSSGALTTGWTGGTLRLFDV